MNRAIIAIVTLAFALSAAVQAQQWPDNKEHRCAHAKLEAAQLNAAAGQALRNPFEPDEAAVNTDVLNYNLELEVDPVALWIGGSNTLTVQSTIDGLDAFQFRLRSVYTISALEVNGVPATWTRLNDDTVAVELIPFQDAGDVFDVTIAYAGYPQSQGSWGSIVFGVRGTNDVPVVWTLSQPWWAHTWWPVKEDNRDKATADLTFTVPANLTVASNGMLQSVTDVGLNQKSYHWRTDAPTAPYLFAFTATNFVTFGATWERDGQSLPLEFYIYPEHNVQANRDVWLLSSSMLDVFTDLYGPYPFPNEKYGIAQFGFGGGMEHQTMTFQGGFWEYITAHELAHQWWGDSITCATWHDVWLNEGLATYSEGLWYEHRPVGGGPDLLHYYMNNFRKPTSSSDTVYVYDVSNMDRVFRANTTYLKGAWVMHMLRHVVGDETFFDILAEYRARFEGGSVTTADFEQACEDVFGRDLSWFFDQWVYKGTWPKYYWAWRSHVADGRNYVEVYIRQQQAGAFSMPVDIHTTSAGVPSIHTVWNDAMREHLLFEVAAPADAAYFDPNEWFLRRDLIATTFTEGPPKIVTLSPAPAAVVVGTALTQLEVGFHKDVVVGASDFQLVGQQRGVVPLAVTYDGTRQVATLTAAAPLAPDWYTLTVFDSIVDVASSQALDGELTKVWFPAPLPSGDGLPGGDAVARFLVTAPGSGDTNCSGGMDGNDVDAFVLALLGGPAAYDAKYPDCDYQTADMNGDGSVNFGDINAFVALISR